MNIEIYTSPTCTYCNNAKALLKQKELDYSEIDISSDTNRASEMIERSGNKTVPQIFINGISIGGFMELAKLNGAGKLVRPDYLSPLLIMQPFVAAGGTRHD